MSERNSSGPVDLSRFADLVDDFLFALAEDVSMSVAMARQAVAIKRKREVWAVRLDLRTAEREARAECESVIPFKCRTQSPCGTGTCRFAKGEFKQLDVPECPGTKYRPQMDSCGRYSLEPALIPLRELRESEK